MSELKAKFLAEIIADPDNDSLRLVYADYLLGLPSINDQRRGRIMALQCSPGWQDPNQRLSLQRKLRSTEKYLPDLIKEDLPLDLSRKTLLKSTFHRGFLYGLQLNAKEWRNARTQLLALAPRIGELHLFGADEIHEEDVRFWRGLTTLQLSEGFYPYGDIVRKLLEACPDAQWRELTVTYGDLGPIQSFPTLPNLRVLRLSPRNQNAILPPAALPWLSRLTRLDLYGHRIHATLLSALPPCLELLSLTTCSIDEDTQEILGEATFLALYRWLLGRPTIRGLTWMRLNEDHTPILEHPRIISKEVSFFGYPSL